MQSDFFEWDDEKADANYRKHGVSFDEACTVLFDNWAIVEEDKRENYGEQRFVSVGMSKQNRILQVVWTQRETKIRLISAFKSDKKQRKSYEKQRY
ncbi:MAG: BrnT family toxin [Neisseriaceae bacterium]|nr:BrnT family toxin [Neisseriaceae bacterium]MBR0129512.1 BrnT family toxin [Neisseriaceae bacterium]